MALKKPSVEVQMTWILTFGIGIQIEDVGSRNIFLSCQNLLKKCEPPLQAHPAKTEGPARDCTFTVWNGPQCPLWVRPWTGGSDHEAREGRVPDVVPRSPLLHCDLEPWAMPH